MVNPLSGHTPGQTASSESLKDGAGLTSTSLTNLYEGLHGNGIIRLDDRAYNDSNRQNTGTNTAGHVTVSGSGSVTVYGGYASLGGVLYSFANGPNSSKTYTAGDTTWHLGSLPAVPASNSDVIVTVYVVADNNTGVANVKHHFGTPVVTSTGTPLTSDTFLSAPGPTNNQEVTVLAVLRYTMTGGAADVTASLNTPTVSDKRCLLSNSPMYLTPLTSGATGGYASGESIDHANRSLDTMNSRIGGAESGAFNASPLGAIWQSHSPDGHAVLYYSARRDQGGSPARNTWRLAPNEVKTITTGSNQTATFDGPNIWVITTTGNITLTPTNTFPHSHTIRVYHPSGSHTLHFDPSGINYDVAAGKSVTFGYNGSAWSVIGLSGAGVGTVTSIATTAPITGGTITTTGTIGISAATTSAAGSMSAADKTKLDGIEANADVTDATNVTAAGALMDSEVTNLAQVKAFDSADYATAAQGTTADNALPKAGGTMSGNITMAGSQTVDGRDLSVDGAKLDAIPTTRAHMFAKITTPGSALTSTVPAVIQHSTTEYDENSDFDASDYAFVAPRDGYYLVSVGFYLNLTPTWSFSMVYKSTDGGSTYPDIVVREVSGSGQKNQLTTVVKLDANDRLRHYANASFSSGTYQVQSANTALTYFRVSELI